MTVSVVIQAADPCATKPSLIVFYHKPECLVKELDCCVQGPRLQRLKKIKLLYVSLGNTVPSEWLK